MAEARALPIKIIGAIVARGSDYAEILVNIVKCRREPCVVSVGVFRNVSEAHLTQELRNVCNGISTISRRDSAMPIVFDHGRSQSASS